MAVTSVTLQGARSFAGYLVGTPFSTSDNFTFSFPYLSKDNFTIKVNSETELQSTHFEFNSDYLIKLTQLGVDFLNGLYASGQALDLIITRETPKDSRLVDFQDGANLTEKELDLQANQNFYLIQESFDKAEFGSLNANPVTGVVQMSGKTILDVGNSLELTSVPNVQKLLDRLAMNDYVANTDYSQNALVMFQGKMYKANRVITKLENLSAIGDFLPAFDLFLDVPLIQAADQRSTDIETNIVSVETVVSQNSSDIATHKHGLVGDVVGSSDVQTLTNKTLTDLEKLECKKDTQASLITYALGSGTNGELLYATDTKEYFGIKDNILTPIGGSGGGGGGGTADHTLLSNVGTKTHDELEVEIQDNVNDIASNTVLINNNSTSISSIDVSPSTIKTSYESNLDTNAFSDGDKSTLSALTNKFNTAFYTEDFSGANSYSIQGSAGVIPINNSYVGYPLTNFNARIISSASNPTLGLVSGDIDVSQFTTDKVLKVKFKYLCSFEPDILELIVTGKNPNPFTFNVENKLDTTGDEITRDIEFLLDVPAITDSIQLEFGIYDALGKSSSISNRYILIADISVSEFESIDGLIFTDHSNLSNTGILSHTEIDTKIAALEAGGVSSTDSQTKFVPYVANTAYDEGSVLFNTTDTLNRLFRANRPVLDTEDLSSIGNFLPVFDLYFDKTANDGFNQRIQDLESAGSSFDHSTIESDILNAQSTADTNTGDILNKEDALGNPDTDGKVLSSLTDGTRSWITPSGGGGGGVTDHTALTSIGTKTHATIDTEIDANISSIASINTSVSNNTTNIGTNSTDIAAANNTISNNATAIGTNSTDIATANTNISSNTTAIGTNSTDIATANAAITANTASITSNDTDIAATTVITTDHGTRLTVLEAGGSGGGSALPIAYYQSFFAVNQREAAAVAGDQTRDLTQIKGDTSFSTLSSSQITLNAGTYEAFGSAPARSAGGHVVYLYNVTDSTSFNLTSTVAASGAIDSTGNISTVSGIFTISSTKVLELRHYTSSATAGTTGLGGGASYNNPSAGHYSFAMLKLTKRS